MTIAKRFLRATTLILLGAVLALALPSCKGSDGDSESDDALSMLLEIVDSEESSAESDYYVVIIPSGASSALAQKANLLVLDIEEITGVDSVLEYDNGDNPRRENAIEIILGNTNRNESRIALAELIVGDYVCKKIDGNIVIGGVSDEDTIIAVDRFMSEILPYSSAEQLMGADAGFEHFAERETPMLLCGFPVKDFTVVCGSDAKMQTLAATLQHAILDKSGSELSVSDTRKDGRKDIILELVKSDSYIGEGYISHKGEDVVLSAYDLYGMQKVVGEFCELLCADKQTDAICLGSDWSVRNVKCPNRPFAVELFVTNESDAGFSRADFVSAVCGDIKTNDPSLVLMNCVSEETLSFMKGITMSKSYSYKTFGADNMLTIAYDDSVSDLSVKLASHGGLTVADISVERADDEPGYNITYIYSDSSDTAADISEKIRTLTNGSDADLVLTSYDVVDADDAVLTELSVLDGNEHICKSNGKWVCVDAFATAAPTALENISGDSLQNNGVPLGFLCHATRISMHRTEYGKAF